MSFGPILLGSLLGGLVVAARQRINFGEALPHCQGYYNPDEALIDPDGTVQGGTVSHTSMQASR